MGGQKQQGECGPPGFCFRSTVDIKYETPQFSNIRQITAQNPLTFLPVTSGTEPGAKNQQEVSSGLQGNAARQRPRTLINPFRYAAAHASNAAHSVAAADAAIQAMNSR
jgi:hypothetical protein